MENSFSRIARDIVEDLPWVENHRLIVGPLTSREAVKDALLEATPVLPSWAVATLPELAAELLTRAGREVQKPLSASSQCDALERIATADFLRERLPDFCGHLRSRQVTLKISRFLTQLDRFYAEAGELEATIEYFAQKDRSLGKFLEVVAGLWSQGQLHPWSDGHQLRGALELVESGGAKLPRTLLLWGFSEFTPLEERFLESLARAGVAIRLAAPPEQVEGLAPRASAMGIEAVTLPAASGRAVAWHPHSTWDELEFLRERLSELRAQGVEWKKIAIHVPNDDLYKRFVRARLGEWNVPLHDPTLSGGWKDKPRWLWWRDLFRLISSGLKLDDVKAWLGPGENRKALFEDAFARGVHGGAKQWARLLEKHDVAELRLLVEGVRFLGRMMTPAQCLEALEKLVPRAEQLLGAENLESALVLEFGRHLCEERPYLEDYRARLPRYTALFEEFLESKSRTLSVREPNGAQFVGHGVWLPESVSHAFVLGTNLITRARPGADVWDWEGAEVRRAWEKLHFGMPWAERVRRDEHFLWFGLQGTVETVYSALDYSLGGKPIGKTALFERWTKDAQVVVRGGNPRVGWQTVTPPKVERVPVVRPDFAVKGQLSVSAFEDYLKCPFLYFARHVLELEKSQELGLDPDGRARGILLHKILGRFIEEELKGKRYADRASAEAGLKKMVREEIDAELKRGNSLSGMYRHEPLIAKTVSLIESRALKWLEWEFDRREKFPALKPFAVEAPLEVPIDAGLSLRGRADRIDSDGKHSVVIDYKTGAPPFTGGELAQGLGAQLLVYAEGMRRAHGLEPAFVHYLGLGRKIEATKGVFLKKHQKTLHETNARNSGLVDSEFGTLFETVSENWRRAAEKLQQGEFSPFPARPNKDCGHCQYKPICGYEADEVIEGE